MILKSNDKVICLGLGLSLNSLYIVLFLLEKKINNRLNYFEYVLIKYII